MLASLPSQSDYAFLDPSIPVFHSANVSEVLRFGVIGWTMSRATGLWVGMKALADIAGLPLAIKGFGHVKTVSEKQASVRLAILLDRWPGDTHAQIGAE